MAVGAYTYAFLVNMGVNAGVAFFGGGMVVAATGFVVGLPALRIKGLYLAIVTLGCVFISGDLILYFGDYTGGHNGMIIPTAHMGSLVFDSCIKKYYLIWTLTVVSLFSARLLKHSKPGRAFSYIRFSEVAAEINGVSLPLYKTLAFSVGCFYTGIDRLTEYMTFIKPEDFETLLFGFLTLVFIILEPNGIYGRWVIIRNYWKAFPLNEVQVKRVRWIRRWR